MADQGDVLKVQLLEQLAYILAESCQGLSVLRGVRVTMASQVDGHDSVASFQEGFPLKLPVPAPAAIAVEEHDRTAITLIVERDADVVGGHHRESLTAHGIPVPLVGACRR